VSYERYQARGSVLVPSRRISLCAIREIWLPSSITVVTAEAGSDGETSPDFLPGSREFAQPDAVSPG
jgi:hypothetical protein